MIQPTPGRVVWYHPDDEDLKGLNDAPMATLAGLPLAAHVVGIHTDRNINVVVFDASGRMHVRHKVQLLQGDDKDDQVTPGLHAYAEWMPYQKAQAERHAVIKPTSMDALDRAAYEQKVEFIARICHEVNRGYCMALDDLSQPAWEDAPKWQRNSARLGVELHLSNPDAGAEASHESWSKQKVAEGWVYGPVEDPTNKQHPYLVPFAQLPVAQQAKDFIFRAIVHALS